MALAGFIAAPAAALAHGGATGIEDTVEHYGVLIFLLAIVLIGAGVVGWVLRAPDPEPGEDETPSDPEPGEDETPPDPSSASASTAGRGSKPVPASSRR